MRSLLSLSFFSPANAILVPGMYYMTVRSATPYRNPKAAAHLFRVLQVLKESLIAPCNALVDVGSGV